MLWRLARTVRSVHERLTLGKLYRGLHENTDPERHIGEAADWLKRAQDVGSDRGVSYGAWFGEGFLPSYPETTGYIIPTFLDLAEVYGDEDYRARALDMGDWEIEIQMDSGAVRGGRVDASPSPAVFNTGMVMLGWLALYRDKGEQRFLEASDRAARWLVQVQEPDGRWEKGNSRFADPKATTYNTRVAWALAWHGKVVGEDGYVNAAVRNGEFALTQQEDSGWFRACCLTDAQRPLVHTLAYATRGLLELGLLVDRQDFVLVARKAADGMLEAMEANGHLAGRLGRNFSPTVKWVCLTGLAQMAIVWFKLYELTSEHRYREAGIRANRYLMQRHDISNPDETLRGGVAGSWPVWGEYGRFMVLNWSTKFLIDALILQKRLTG